MSAGTNVSYQWDFGDGGLGSGPFVQHTYSTGGAYTLSVTASNSTGSVLVSEMVTILEPANINGVVWYDKDEDGFFGLGKSSNLDPGGAVVTATLQNPPAVISDVRDNQGNYQIFTPQSGTYGVAVSKSMWHATSPNPVTVAMSTAGGVTLNFGMNLDPTAGTGRINGRAWVDSNGSGFPEPEEIPLSGLVVTLRNAGGIVSQSTTDATGWINLASLVPGAYWVDVTAPAGTYPSVQSRMVQVIDGLVANAHAPFLPGGSITGKVSGHNGLGIGGVTLTVLPENLQTTTANDGSYSFTGLIAGDRTLKITPPLNHVTLDGLNDRLVSVTLNNGVVENFSLLRKGRLTVRATQFNNGQVLPVYYMLFELLQNDIVLQLVMTDVNGQAVFDGLVPGTYSARPLNAAVLPGTLVTPAQRTAIVTYDSAATLSFSFTLARSLSLFCRLPGMLPGGFNCLYEVRNSNGNLIDSEALPAANPATTLWNLNPATLEVRLIPDPAVPGQASWPVHSQIVVLGDNTQANVYYPFNPTNLQTISGYAYHDHCAPLGTRANTGTCNETGAASNNNLTVTLFDSAEAVVATTDTGRAVGSTAAISHFPTCPLAATA